jgi:hypothetical protein
LARAAESVQDKLVGECAAREVGTRDGEGGRLAIGEAAAEKMTDEASAADRKLKRQGMVDSFGGELLLVAVPWKKVVWRLPLSGIDRCDLGSKSLERPVENSMPIARAIQGPWHAP